MGVGGHELAALRPPACLLSSAHLPCTSPFLSTDGEAVKTEAAAETEAAAAAAAASATAAAAEDAAAAAAATPAPAVTAPGTGAQAPSAIPVSYDRLGRELQKWIQCSQCEKWRKVSFGGGGGHGCSAAVACPASLPSACLCRTPAGLHPRELGMPRPPSPALPLRRCPMAWKIAPSPTSGPALTTCGMRATPPARCHSS